MLQATCGPLVPGVIDPPKNAVLYLSVRGPGKIMYKCVEKNNPIVLSESATMTADPKISKGWSATLETKDGVRVLTTKNSNQKPSAENVFVLGDRPVSRTVLDAAPDLRWEVVSNEGASADQGGIPAGGNYVTRTFAEGGAPPRTCDAGQTVEADFEASYNIYSCDSAYLTGSPASGPEAESPVVSVPPTAAQSPVVSSPSVSVPPVVSSPPVSVPPVVSTPPVAPSPSVNVTSVPPSPVAVPPSPSVPVVVPPAIAPAPQSSAAMVTGGLLALILAAF